MSYDILRSIRLEKDVEGATQAPVLYTAGQTDKTREELHPFIRDLLEQRAIEWDIAGDGGAQAACGSSMSATLRRIRGMAAAPAPALSVSVTGGRIRSMAAAAVCVSSVVATAVPRTSPAFAGTSLGTQPLGSRAL